ncbi:hypothetical protein EDB19DRAFT_1949495 [Suillus lakei]|nr:hypothetical protein EDB19DRAFT_1949495 [Suillus lakei]
MAVLKPQNNQLYSSLNSLKPPFMAPRPGNSERQSAVSMLSNGSQRPCASTWSSNLSENPASRNLANAGLCLPNFKLSATASSESHRPSSQRSSSFFDTKGGSSARRPIVKFKEEDCNLDGHNQFTICENKLPQRYPADNRNSPSKTATEEIAFWSSPGALKSDMTADDLIGTQMASNHSQTKVELARLREHSTKLESQLGDKTKVVADLTRQNEELSRQASDAHHQNATLSQRIAQLKSTTKEAVEKANRSSADLRGSCEELQIRFQASSALVNDARKTMESLEELRDAARTGLQVFLDGTGHPSNVGKTRAVVTELQAELTRTQQVADLLCENLQNMGSELVDTRARVTELEEHFGNDRKLITSTTLDLERTSKRVADMAESLKLEGDETIDALIKLAQAEDQLVHCQSRLREREATVHSMQQGMESMRQEISERDEGKAQMQILQNTVTLQEHYKKDLEGRLQKAEAELVHARNRSHDLESCLEVSKDLEKALARQDVRLTSEGESIRERLRMAEVGLADIRNLVSESSGQSVRLASERDTLLRKLETAYTQLADAKQEEESYVKVGFAETRTSLKALQERFDDQLVTLGLTKESVGEVGDHLQSTNDAILALNENLEESNSRASAAEGRERSLQQRLDEANVATATERNLVSSLKKELFDLSRQQGQAIEHIAEQRARDAEQRIQELNSKTDSQCGELGENQRVISELTQRLAIAETPDQHEQDLLVLKTRVHELEESEKQLLQRATNITVRYEQNDLNDSEQTLVQSIANKAREVFEHELVEKNSDIQKRDNLIKQHESRIKQLEASLDRRIGEFPQVGRSRDDRRDETFQSRPPSGRRDRQNSSVHEAANHSVVKEPGRPDRIPPGTLANDDPGIEEFENEKGLAARQVKRMISPEWSTRPARRPKISKSSETEKVTDEVGVFSHCLSSRLEFVSGPRLIKGEDEQATTSVVSRDGLHPVTSLPLFTIQQTPEGWSSADEEAKIVLSKINARKPIHTMYNPTENFGVEQNFSFKAVLERGKLGLVTA